MLVSYGGGDGAARRLPSENKIREIESLAAKEKVGHRDKRGAGRKEEKKLLYANGRKEGRKEGRRRKKGRREEQTQCRAGVAKSEQKVFFSESGESLCITFRTFFVHGIDRPTPFVSYFPPVRAKNRHMMYGNHALAVYP